MSLKTFFSALNSCGLLVTLLAVLAPNPASAAKQCDKLFPDITCEDHQGRYEGFIPTQTFAYLFEDPFITSGLYLRYVNQDFPQNSVMDGGNIKVYAIQARLAITDKLAFIATKDGWAKSEPDLSVLDNQDGYFDISAGFKYQLIGDRENKFALAPALRVELPVGQRDVYSGHHDGLIIPSISLAKGFDDLHLIAGTGGVFSLDRDKGSDYVFYNVQIDYNLGWLSPYIGLNGIYYTAEGDSSTPIKTNALGTVPLSAVQALVPPMRGYEGAEVLNLGSDDVKGNSLITGTIGTYVPISETTGVGVAYEIPFGRKDLNARRLNINFLLEF